MKKVTVLLFLMYGMLHSCSSNKIDVPQEEPTEIIFQDDFEFFNSEVWTKEVHEAGWTNEELQEYTESQVTVGMDGDKSVLILTAERKGDRIISGRVNSKGKMSFKYGRIEASIKLPKIANGLWPAFWMMGENLEWPECGEIDILEMGEQGAIASGTTETQVNTAIHYGTDNGPGHRQEYYSANVENSLLDGQYHIYALDWNENTLTVSIDNVKFYSFDISKVSGRYEYFHDEFFVLFNLAVGGAFPGITNVDEITALKDGEKASMYIDWVKIVN